MPFGVGRHSCRQLIQRWEDIMYVPMTLQIYARLILYCCRGALQPFDLDGSKKVIREVGALRHDDVPRSNQAADKLDPRYPRH